MAWVYLVVAGIFECGWAISLKYTEGFTRPVPSLVTAIGLVCSFWLLSLAMKALPVGTAYAAWTGIGAVGVALIGIVFLGEPRDLPRLLCLGLIVAGVVGLQLVSRSAGHA